MKEPEFRYIDLLEGQLRRNLRRIEPNPAFVNRLQHNLANPSNVRVEDHRKGTLLVAVGITSVMLATGAGLAFLLVNRKRNR